MDALTQCIRIFLEAMRNTPSRIRRLVSNNRGRSINMRYSKSTIKSYRDILLNKGGAYPIYPFLLNILAKRTLSLSDALSLNKGVDETKLKITSKNAKKKVTRNFIRFLVEEGYINEEKYAVDSITQTEVPREHIVVLSPQQRDVWDNEEWSRLPVINLRNKLMFGILRRYGDRPGLEMSTCNLASLDKKLWELEIQGKGGKVRYHRIFAKDVPLFEEYLVVRAEHIATIPGYPDEEALWIKLHPSQTGRSNEGPTWRLSSVGIWACYDRMREKYPVLAGTKPYTARNTRITHAHIVCQILGIPIEYMSKAFGNELCTRLKHYDSAVDLQEELFCADFDTELEPMLMEIEHYCDFKLKQNPGDRLYELCKKRIQDKLGEITFLKVMVGRSPSFRQSFRSDSEDDFYALWQRKKNGQLFVPQQDPEITMKCQSISAPEPPKSDFFVPSDMQLPMPSVGYNSSQMSCGSDACASWGAHLWPTESLF